MKDIIYRWLGDKYSCTLSPGVEVKVWKLIDEINFVQVEIYVHINK